MKIPHPNGDVNGRAGNRKPRQVPRTPPDYDSRIHGRPDADETPGPSASGEGNAATDSGRYE